MTTKTQEADSAGPGRQLFVTLDQLHSGNEDDFNARRTGREAGVERLAAHIKQHGLLMPLLVKRNGGGKMVVVDGNRRLLALWLNTDKAGAPGVRVPVYLRDDIDSGKDASLATFLYQVPLHPVDEFEAFAYLRDVDGLAPERIAERHGLKVKDVRQRLALGSLSPKIRKAWREKKISEDTAQAFTLGATHEDQDRVFADLDKARSLWDYHVRAAFLRNAREAAGLLKLVGKKEYGAAGGSVIVDLFSDETGVSDFALLQSMAAEKIAEECKRLVDKDGWAWAEPLSEDGTHERFRWKQIGLKNKKEDRAKAGVFVRVGHDGSLEVEGGYIRPKPGSKGDEAGKGGKAAKAKGKPKEPDEITQALGKRLTAQKYTAIKMALDTEAKDIDSGGNLFALALSILSTMIKPESGWQAMPPELLDAIENVRDAISPTIMGSHMREAFDAPGYFAGINRAQCILAMEEFAPQVSAAWATKPKGEVEKACVELCEGWLPKELRFAGYAGTAGGDATAKKHRAGPKGLGGKRGVARKGQGKGRTRK